VVDPVTRYALHRGVLVPGARVADGTADVPVLSSQGECRGLVIEASALPGLLPVAVGTRLAQATVVGIYRLVTGDAGRRRVAVLRLRGVALDARHPLVRAFEAEVGDGMVEDLAIQQHDIDIPALMVRVTVPAFGALHVPAAAMEPAARGQVGGDLVVTVQAEGALSGLVKRLVAARALLLILGVALDERAGHEELLHVDGRRPRRPECEDKETES